MSTKNEDVHLPDNMEALKPEASACSPGCGCHGGKPACRARWIVGAIIILAAGVLVARALIKNHGVSAEQAMPGFASLQVAGKVPVPLTDATPATSALRRAERPNSRMSGDAAKNEASAVPAPVAVQEIGALSELNAMAADTGGVFVFLPGKNEPLIKAPLAQMRNAAKTVETQGQKIGLFILKAGSPDYVQAAAQMPVPCVLAMVKGRRMIPVVGKITEAKLIQGFVAASSAGGCGAGGCGPRGCN